VSLQLLLRRLTLLIIVALAFLCPAVAGIVAEVQPDSVASLSDRPLYMHIASLKESYFEGESVQLTYWVENLSSIQQYYRDDEIEPLTILDDRGLKVKGCKLCVQRMPVMRFNHKDSTLSPTDWKVIDPHEVVQKYPSDLLYGQVWVKRFKCGSLRPGMYTITGDHIRSDTISISVLDPAGTTESDAAQQFKVAMDYGAEHGGVTRQGHFGLLEEFLLKFPSSVYVPRALGELLAGDSNQSARAAELLVTEYPEYSYAGEAIWRADLKSVHESLQVKFATGLKKIRNIFSELSPTVKRIDELIRQMEEKK
jgi:hypothetical protein